MSSFDDSGPVSDHNPDIEAMHCSLVALVRRLEESIDLAPDAEAIALITEQMGDVNARVTSTGRVLLSAQSEEVARLARAVADAIPIIEKKIEDLEDRERVVRSVTAMLGTVDEAVRVATLACP